MLLNCIQEKVLWGAVEKDLQIEEICADSRKKMSNGLFICLRGNKVDSHTCVKQAFRNGAIALVAEEKVDVPLPQILVKDTREALSILASCFYGNPSSAISVVGITGTNGKTTTAHMLAEIWRKAGKKVGIIGTLGISYGKKKISADLTTPDPIILQETLANMRSAGVECVVMEVSAHALYYKKTAGVTFKACIFTNFTQDHLDFFQTMQDYKIAKQSLFAQSRCPIAILNGDDEVGREVGRLRAQGEEQTFFYGLITPSETFAVITEEDLYGTECILNLEDKLCRISLQMTGRHNVYNALAAATCAMAMGISAEDITKGLNDIKGVDGRLQRVGGVRGADVYIDFAHTPDGLEKSLETLKKYCKGRLLCVFGCGGNRDKGKRPLMGEIVAKKTDFAVLTSDNPRFEDPLDIITEIEKGYRKFSARYVIVPDRKTAIEYALDMVKKNDILLVAGKGGEEYQEIMGIKYPFNDYTVIEKMLQRKAKEFHR